MPNVHWLQTGRRAIPRNAHPPWASRAAICRQKQRGGCRPNLAQKNRTKPCNTAAWRTVCLLCRSSSTPSSTPANIGDLSGDAEWLLRHFLRAGLAGGPQPDMPRSTPSPTSAPMGTWPISAGTRSTTMFWQGKARRPPGRARPGPASEAARSFFRPRPRGLGRDPAAGSGRVSFYAAAAGLELAGAVDLVAHFAYRGWREERWHPTRLSIVQRPAGRAAPSCATPASTPCWSSWSGWPSSRPKRHLAPPRQAERTRTIPASARPGSRAVPCSASPTGSTPCRPNTRAQRADLAGQYTDPVERVVAEHLDRSYYTGHLRRRPRPRHRSRGAFLPVGMAGAAQPGSPGSTPATTCRPTPISSRAVSTRSGTTSSRGAEGRRPHRPGGFRRDIIERAVDPGHTHQGLESGPNRPVC